jgi:hypothetical protein
LIRPERLLSLIQTTNQPPFMAKEKPAPAICLFEKGVPGQGGMALVGKGYVATQSGLNEEGAEMPDAK